MAKFILCNTSRLGFVKLIALVVSMFAGIGPFSILIAKKNQNTTIITIDKNINAVQYLKQSIACYAPIFTVPLQRFY
ncbi:MAG: Met-10+ like-protein [Candidatus Argoarchaeum ethanivorans]|uniref:Met-10+ like-protein n=1 Tax=Candidatus Argoarchaeum ethanivorans TaxID=2608793 RepID=A0A811TC24_9EURY|nr:MAG: Met-10+ like-protein [Candidatus Argoarchaeum ethanivorans]